MMSPRGLTKPVTDGRRCSVHDHCQLWRILEDGASRRGRIVGSRGIIGHLKGRSFLIRGGERLLTARRRGSEESRTELWREEIVVHGGLDGAACGDGANGRKNLMRRAIRRRVRIHIHRQHGQGPFEPAIRILLILILTARGTRWGTRRPRNGIPIPLRLVQEREHLGRTMWSVRIVVR